MIYLNTTVLFYEEAVIAIVVVMLEVSLVKRIYIVY